MIRSSQAPTGARGRLLPWWIVRQIMRLPVYQVRRKLFFALRWTLSDPGRPIAHRDDAGLALQIDLADEIDAGIYLRTFEPEIAHAATRLLHPGDCVFDVGANNGYLALTFAAIVGSAGVVVAFEPSPLAAARLRRNLALNADHRVAVVEAAMGEHPGAAQLVQQYRERSSTATVWAGRPTEENERQAGFAACEVPVRTIDEYCSAASVLPAMVKIDVEGAELSVLKGAEQLLREHRPLLILELAAVNLAKFGVTPREVIDWLQQTLGYQLFWIERSGLRALTAADAHLLANVNQNVIATHGERHRERLDGASAALAAAKLPRRDFEVWPVDRLASRSPRRYQPAC